MVLGPFAETKEPVLSVARRREGEGPVLSEVEGTSSCGDDTPPAIPDLIGDPGLFSFPSVRYDTDAGFPAFAGVTAREKRE